MKQNFHDALEMIYEKDKRYKPQAYEFVMEALNYTQKKFNRLKHVTGRELLKGIKDLLMIKFGPMATYVLEQWGIEKTEDFGNIVFNLVKNKVLSKTDEDSLEDFRNGYDFRETFDLGYRKLLEKRISRMRSF